MEGAKKLQDTSSTPQLDAELLLAHLLGWGRARLIAFNNDSVSNGIKEHFYYLIARRIKLEPIAYLIGNRDFYGLNFHVDSRVLIPRPETELLVDIVLSYIEQAYATNRSTMSCSSSDNLEAAKHAVPSEWKSRKNEKVQTMYLQGETIRKSPDLETASPMVVADIGTGSGAIAITLAYNTSNTHVYAVDVSIDALAVATINIQNYHLQKHITLLHGNMLEPLPKPVNIIVSNPPYTILSDITPGVYRHEPHLALDGGADGLDAYRQLIAQAPQWLAPEWMIALEIGDTQAVAVSVLLRDTFPSAAITVYQDLAGHDRVVVAVGGL